MDGIGGEYMKEFFAKPDQLEMKIRDWDELDTKRYEVEYIYSYNKLKVYAITFTDFSIPLEKKKRIYISQPHAHEPATTAGMINVMEQLVTGYDLFGNKASLDVEKVLKEMVITFNPIGNPFGSYRSPVQYWDGSVYENKDFFKIMFGQDRDDPEKRIWGRIGLWDTREVRMPKTIGIVYEPIDEFRYVEPNRSQLSSYFKLFHKMNARYDYNYWLELHQTEFENSDKNCMIILGEDNDTEVDRDKIKMADHVTEEWIKNGYIPRKPGPSGYTGVQAEYFIKNYSKIEEKIVRLTSEVKNNAKDFGPEKQMDANCVVILSSINYIRS